MGPLGIPLIVIVIFLVVWIVSNVIRAQQDAAQAAARRQNVNRQAGVPARAENRGNSDIDRFLQEIDRLRKKGQQDKQQQQDDRAAPPSPLAPKPKPVGDRRPELARARGGAPRPQREPRPASPAPPSAPSSPRQPTPIVPELIASPEPANTSKPGSLASNIEAKAETARILAEAASRAAPGAGTQIATPARPRSSGTVVSLSPTLQLIQKLLRSKQGTSVAIILHEVLGPPRSLRR
jgi:hypothetical protein